MVITPVRNRVQFVIESMLLSGTLMRLALAAAVIAVTAGFTGILGFLAAWGTEQSFEGLGQAVWWSFLRLSDPGYLGDDEGFYLRVVSTLVTVAGYVLFLGVLVAILTQGLNEQIRKMEMGLTPISQRSHVIFLGWSNRMPGILRNVVVSEKRLRRFLRRVGAKRLKMVLLVEEVMPTHTAELRSHLGHRWDPSDVILRSGSPLRLDHLMRVDYLNASAIVLPAQDRGTHRSAGQSDNAAIKTILSISHSLRLSAAHRKPPLLVAELYDARKIPVALKSYGGPIEVVAGDEVVSRLLAQMVHHRQISLVYRELLSHALGNEIFARDCPPSFVGTPFWALAEALREAILIGVTRTVDGRCLPLLNPAPDFCFEDGDKLVYIARDWADGFSSVNSGTITWPEPSRKLSRRLRDDLRILIVGWSRRVPALLSELEDYAHQKHRVTIVSRFPLDERNRRMEHYGFTPQRTEVEQIDADYTLPESMRALRPESFDMVVCLASDMTETDQEADARSLVAYAILKDQFAGLPKKPRILIELLDELNVALVDPVDSEYLLSPQILSHILVQVTLRRELNAVFQELFNSGSKEIRLRDFGRYGWKKGTSVSFAEMEHRAREHNEIALGIVNRDEVGVIGGGVYLNPHRTTRWKLGVGDQFVVLTG